MANPSAEAAANLAPSPPSLSPSPSTSRDRANTAPSAANGNGKAQNGSAGEHLASSAGSKSKKPAIESRASASPPPRRPQILDLPHRFNYSERNRVPRVENVHIPWDKVMAAPMSGEAVVRSDDPPRSPSTSEGKRNSSNQDSHRPHTAEYSCDEDADPHTARVKRKHSKVVTDPITRKEVNVVDAKYLQPQPIASTLPAPGPPASWTNYSNEVRNLTLKYLGGILLLFLFLSGLLRLHMSFPLFLSLGAILAWYRQIDSLWLDIVYHDPVLYHRHHRKQSSATSELSSKNRRHSRRQSRSGSVVGGGGPESVFWLNNTIAKLWPQVNADLFKPVTDLLEDVMQASIPSIVQQIRIRDIGQGTEPVRILSMRWLDDDYDDGEIDLDADDSSAEGSVKRAGVEDDQESIGEWASMEITFAFRGKGREADPTGKAANPFLMVYMSLGLKGVLGAPEVPIWVQLRGLHGTCRLRVQLIPDPPFVKLTTFSLMGMPRIEISAVPLNQKFLNVMSLPVISDFVYSSIKTTAKEFCAPKSYTLDLSKVLVGDDTKKELFAIGVLIVHIDRAEGVRAADTLTGKSDCYVTLSYSKFAKTLWSSRIIFCDLNPVWDETAILILNADEIKAQEKLSLELWDSDRFTVDDLLGRIEVDVGDLVSRKGEVIHREDSLMGYHEAHVMPGKMKWSVCFQGKAGLDHVTPKGVEDEISSIADISRTAFTAAGLPPPAPSDESALVTKFPPSPLLPSGILSIQVHNIVSLSCQPSLSTRASGQRIGVSTTTEEEEEGESLPSSYCSIMLDYQKIYKTRVKPMTSKPFFNAGTERFVRDWTQSSVIVAVRDNRMRETDPILGVVELKLKDVFQHESVVSRYYPIQGGIGYGKIRISLLFRSIDTVLPKMLLGADIGSVEIMSRFIDSSNIIDEEVRKAGSIIFETPLIKKKAVRGVSPVAGDATGWIPAHDQKGSKGFRLGVRHRHSAPCVLIFKRDPSAFGFRRNKVLAAAKFWLKDIPDDEATSLRLLVYKPEDMDRFMQNAGTGEHGLGQKVGFIDIKVKFHRGLGKSHRIVARTEKDFADVIQAVQAAGGSLRGDGGPDDHDSVDTGDEGFATDSEGEDHVAPPPQPTAPAGLGRGGTLREKFRRRSSSHRKSQSNGLPGDSAVAADTTTNGNGEPSSSLVADTIIDGHSSSDGNEGEFEVVGNGAAASASTAAPRNSRNQRSKPPIKPRIMTQSQVRKEMNRRERGVMQWKGARTLAWVGRGVKDAGRGVKGKLALGLGEGRDKRVGERGRNVGYGTEA